MCLSECHITKADAVYEAEESFSQDDPSLVRLIVQGREAKSKVSISIKKVSRLRNKCLKDIPSLVRLIVQGREAKSKVSISIKKVSRLRNKCLKDIPSFVCLIVQGKEAKS